MSITNPNESHPPARIMIFIDGGYLRKGAKELWGIDLDNFLFTQFSIYIAQKVFGSIKLPQIIRTYFYDGLVDPIDKKFELQNESHKKIIREHRGYEIRQGRLIKLGDGKYRQKGVDVLMAIDMIDKANSNQYDVALIVAGDLDHIEAIKNIRNKGKQIVDVFFRNSIAEDILLNVDDHLELSKGSLEKIRGIDI